MRSLKFEARDELAKLAKAQRRLLPLTTPNLPDYAFVVAYRPAYFAAGDYYDFFFRQNGSVGVFLGDGCGHGPTASLLMAGMRAILLTHPELHGDPGTVLTASSRMFRAITPSDLFMTGLYLLFHEGGRVSWAAAGHDPPLRFSQRGGVAPVDLAPIGLPLGLDPHEEYRTVHWELSPGERLLLYTDGLVEAASRNDEPFGRLRLRSCLTDMTGLLLDNLVPELLARASAHVDGADFEDDFTIIAVERRTRHNPS